MNIWLSGQSLYKETMNNNSMIYVSESHLQENPQKIVS